MNLHEYQAKQFLKKYGIPVPEGWLANDMKETEAVLDEHFPKGKAVLKAQIHSGGRGKAGGVLISQNKEDALQKAKSLFGKTLVTKQTGPKGKVVHKIYLETPSSVEKEMYLSLLIDTNTAKHTFVACKDGGTSIEELAESHPEAILKCAIEPSKGLTEEDIISIAGHLDVDKDELRPILQGLSGLTLMTKLMTSSIWCVSKKFLTGS